MVLLYMVTFTIKIPQMLAYIPVPWILWVCHYIMIPATNARQMACPCLHMSPTAGCGPADRDKYFLELAVESCLAVFPGWVMRFMYVHVKFMIFV